MTYEIEYDDVENVLAEVVIQRIAEVRSRMQSAVSSLTDADLQRFLMFHKYNLETAIEAIEKYLRWREEKRLDELQLRPDGINVPHILHVRKFTGIMEDANFTKDQPCLPKEYKRFYEAQGGGGIHGVDKEGRPIYIARIGQYNVQKLADTCPAEVFENYHIRAYEFVYKVILPEASRLKGGPIEQITNIFDCTGMGLHQFHIPGIMLLKMIADINQEYYPERIHKLYVVNAPAFFQAAWAIIKLWLNERALSKIVIMGSDFKSKLNEIIDHDQLPVHLGGSCTCAHMDGGCCPSPEELRNIYGDPHAPKNETTFKGTQNTHILPLKIRTPGMIKFRYECTSICSMEIRDEFGNAIYSIEDDEVIGKVSVETGKYEIKWHCRNVSSFRSTKLEYTVDHIATELPARLDSAVDVSLFKPDDFNNQQSFEDQFYDAISTIQSSHSIKLW